MSGVLGHLVIASWFPLQEVLAVASCASRQPAQPSVPVKAPTTASSTATGTPIGVQQGSIGTSGEVTASIRSNLMETASDCDLRPPSPAEQAEWRRLQKPRELGQIPLRDSARRNDGEPTMEVSGRLLDEMYDTGIAGMTEPEQDVYFVDELAREVNNGGFHQCFSNSSGNCMARTIAAARTIDSRLGQLFERALSRFPDDGPSEDRAARNAQVTTTPNEWEAWSRLDKEFFAFPVDSVLARYIRANLVSFDCPQQDPTAD